MLIHCTLSTTARLKKSGYVRGFVYPTSLTISEIRRLLSKGMDRTLYLILPSQSAIWMGRPDYDTLSTAIVDVQFSRGSIYQWAVIPNGFVPEIVAEEINRKEVYRLSRETYDSIGHAMIAKSKKGGGVYLEFGSSVFPLPLSATSQVAEVYIAAVRKSCKLWQPTKFHLVFPKQPLWRQIWAGLP